jgi:predicted NUDIX family NTP pyrophosphohydrolase
MKSPYRIQTAEGKIKFAGTDQPSWFNLEQAREKVNRTEGETIIESDGIRTLWEVL